MLLYHYSTEKYNSLKNLASRGLPVDKDTGAVDRFNKETESVGYYWDHISFFFDPIPLDLPKILNREHDFWRPGVELYQYTVDTEQLNIYLYRIVETATDYNELLKSSGLDLDNRTVFNAYKLKVNRLKKANGEIGTDISSFERYSGSFIGGTRDAFMEQNKKIESLNGEGANLYAAFVPHVMMYLKEGHGVVKYKSVKRIKLRGENKLRRW